MPGMEVRVLPVLRDNYCYIVRCTVTNEAAVIDVSETERVFAALRELGVRKWSILSTHKHHDHTGGNARCAAAVPGLHIYGGRYDSVPACTHVVDDGSQFKIGELNVTVLHTPCHTRGHVLYHITPPSAPLRGAVFTGDTLFVGGIGKFFEGGAAEMLAAVRRIAALPPQTAVFVGHEYTAGFLTWAATLERSNARLQEKAAWAKEMKRLGRPTVPSTVADEIATNIYMRTASPELRAACGGLADDVAMMQYLHDV